MPMWPPAAALPPLMPFMLLAFRFGLPSAGNRQLNSGHGFTCSFLQNCCPVCRHEMASMWFFFCTLHWFLVFASCFLPPVILLAGQDNLVILDPLFYFSTSCFRSFIFILKLTTKKCQMKRTLCPQRWMASAADPGEGHRLTQDLCAVS